MLHWVYKDSEFGAHTRGRVLRACGSPGSPTEEAWFNPMMLGSRLPMNRPNLSVWCFWVCETHKQQASGTLGPLFRGAGDVKGD